jgi:hypothetical protein
MRARDDLLGGRDAVEHRHLDIEDHQIRSELDGEPHRGLAVAGLADHLEALLLQHLLEVEPDEGLVLGDEDTTAASGHLQQATDPLG